MNSNLIYIPKTDRTPYFYIIQHIPSGKLYAGSKYGRDATPSNFMTEGGYYTSSNKIKRIIEVEGFASFKIIQLMSESECGISVYSYETRFLRDNKIAQRDNWFNSHNNTISTFHSVEYKTAMIKTFGFENPNKSHIIKDKIRETSKIKYGVDHYTQNTEVIAKRDATMIEKYGAKTPMQSEKLKNDIIQTLLDKYGVDNPMKDEDIKNRANATWKERHGKDSPNGTRDIQHKKEQTFLSIYGVKNPSQSEEIKDKKKATCLKNHGVEHPGQIQKPKLECPHCKKKVDKSAFGRWHGDNCRNNPLATAINLICKHCLIEIDERNVVNFNRWHGDNCKHK